MVQGPPSPNPIIGVVKLEFIKSDHVNGDIVFVLCLRSEPGGPVDCLNSQPVFSHRGRRPTVAEAKIADARVLRKTSQELLESQTVFLMW